jgi:KDO2-lipid IV(A) lauroyltransferase
MIGASVYKLGAFFARRLPQRLSESITQWIVASQYVARFRSRRIVRHNLTVVLGKETDKQELHLMTKRVFANFGRSIYYFLRLPFIDKTELRHRCDFNGLDAVADRVVKDGGCIFVGPHLGAWEIGGACLTLLGVPLLTVALPHPSASVTRFFDDRRELVGVECWSFRGSAQSLQKALRSGKSVALLIDRVYGGRTGRFRWFGQDVELPLGHVALAVRCQVPVITTACVFEGEGFKFVFGGPHYPRTGLGYRVAMKALQEQCIADMTGFIRDYPDQWFHFQSFGDRTLGKNNHRYS